LAGEKINTSTDAGKEILGGEKPHTNIKVGLYRWTICGLLFFATVIIYMDRQVFGILAPVLQKSIGWNEIEYGYIIAAFSGSYALGLLFVGRFIDKVGTKIGYFLSILVWSIAAIGHAFVRTVLDFGLARSLLGFGESGNFPAANKAIAEWFPKKERALAFGIFNSGANVGAVVAPLLVPWITITWGWQADFIFVGLLGFVWIALWAWLYEIPEKNKNVTQSEVAYIQSDPEIQESEKIPWLKLLKYRQSWAFILGKFLTDPIWWFYLYWLPKFLNQRYGLNLTHLGLPLIAIYTMATIGSVGGGWLSGRLIQMGWSINKGRKIVMLICAISIVPIVFVFSVSEWWAVLLIGLATAGHQGWSTNLFTSVSDMFPKKAVGSVVGLGGMAGSIGGMLISAGVGFILQITGSYLSIFILAGAVYLPALFIFHRLVPKMEEAKMS
jgi:ACS family hexuronate transporter-like MFS transporter